IDRFPPGLPALYDRMMRLTEQQSNLSSLMCRAILRTVTLSYRPLTLKELTLLAELPDQADFVDELVRLCGSFVIRREDTIRFLHQSAKDYLEAEYSTRLHEGGVAQGHADIGRRSLTMMSSV